MFVTNAGRPKTSIQNPLPCTPSPDASFFAFLPCGLKKMHMRPFDCTFSPANAHPGQAIVLIEAEALGDDRCPQGQDERQLVEMVRRP